MCASGDRVRCGSLSVLGGACALLAGAAHGQAPAPSTPPWQSASPWPDRVIVTIEQNPRTSFSVTWRTDDDVITARAEIIEASARARFDIDARTMRAVSETVDLNTKIVDGQAYELPWNAAVGPVRYHSVTFTDLLPDTLYAYRVMGAEGHWSEWFQTRTAPAKGEPLKFLYFGDAQNGILSHWARMVRAAYARAPDARFAIHAGDLVNFASRDFEWAEWFKSVSYIHGMIPAVPVPGNHDYVDRDVTRQRLLALSVLWRPQFALPTDPSLPEALRETVYRLDYGDLLVVALDSMASAYFAEQAEWLDGVLSATDARWRVLTMHHPVFDAVDRTRSSFLQTGPARREHFLPVIDKHGVDLVLQGHDHVYARGAAMQPSTGWRIFQRDRVSTVYVTSVAGPKMYGFQDRGWSDFAGHGVELQRRGENTPLFQVVEIVDDSLLFEAYTATGRLYDAFRLNKTEGRPNELIQIPVERADERLFETTGPYRDQSLDRVPPRPSGHR